MPCRIVLENCQIFDGVDDHVLRGKKIVLQGATIERIIDDDEPVEGAEHIDVNDAFVSPGFIDCHMHMLLEEVPDQEASLSITLPGGGRKDTADYAAAYMGVRNCTRLLNAGFTTALDGGGNNYIECVMREAIKKGYFEGPNLFVAGKQITATKAHFPGFSIEAYSPYGMRKAVRDLAGNGVDFIKLQCSPPIRMVVRNTDACDVTEEEIFAAVDEAHNYGLPVHAHLRGPEAVKRFLRADGDIVIHGTGIDDEGIEMMLKRGKYLCPTLLSPTCKMSPELLAAKCSEEIDLLKNTAKKHWTSISRAYQAGVKIAFSTDTGTLGIAHGTNAREFQNLVEIGMSNAEALRAATSEAAKAIGQSGRLGLIKEGYRADLTVLRGNALDDISATGKVEMTIKSGKIVFDNRKGRL